MSLTQVRESLKKDADETVVFRLIYRPLGNLLTPLFMRAGWSADAVTYLRLLLSTVALILLALGRSWSVLAYVVLYYLVHALDATDGNIARLRDEASYWGKFVDGIADNALAMLSPFVGGIGLFMVWGHTWGLAVGALVSVVSAHVQMLRSRLSFFRDWMISETGALAEPVRETVARRNRVEARIASALELVRAVAPLVLLTPMGLSGFCAFFGLTQAPLEVFWTLLLVAQANRMLRRHRVSKHAARS